MSILYLDIAIVYSQYGNLCMLVFYLYVAILTCLERFCMDILILSNKGFRIDYKIVI
jgi:hypothetical protein